MSEEEYWETNGEYEDHDEDEVLGEYLIDEPDDDLTLIMMPKFKYDFEENFEVYYKLLKKCKTKAEMKTIIFAIVEQVSKYAVIEHEIQLLQERAKDLEFNVQVVQQSGY